MVIPYIARKFGGEINLAENLIWWIWRMIGADVKIRRGQWHGHLDPAGSVVVARRVLPFRVTNRKIADKFVWQPPVHTDVCIGLDIYNCIFIVDIIILQ